MGNIKCLQCNKEITTISGMSCPHCGAKLSHVLISFLSYLGPEDSLNGYQRSYKLVFLHGLFSELKHNGVATVAKVTERFRNFYLDRKRSGLVPDVEVDNRIQNVEGSSLRDIWIMIQMNPYAVISKKGFVTVRGGLDGIFVLQKGIDRLSTTEIDGLLNLLNIKLDLYYKKIGSAMLPTKEFAITQVSNINAGKIQTTPVRQQVIDSIHKKDSKERTQEKGIIVGKASTIPTDADDSTPLEKILLSNRAYNALKRHGVDTLGQMRAEFESGSIAEIKNIGRAVLNEIGALISSTKKMEDQPSEHLKELQEDPQKEQVSDEIFDGTFENTLGENAPNVTVDGIFSDSAFNLFRTFCYKRNIRYASDLIGLRYDELVKEKGFGKTRIAKIIERWEAAKNFVPAQTMTKTVEEQLVVQLDEIAQNRSFDILNKRISGHTLQEIADEYGLTRERVRQICINIESKIYIQIRQLVSILLDQNNGEYFREAQLQEYIDNKIHYKAIVHTLRERKEYFTFGSPAVFINVSSFPKVETDLIEVVERIVGDGINVFDSERLIETTFEEAGYGFLGADEFLELLFKYEYVFYGDYVVKSAKAYGKLCAQIVAESFPEGISGSESDLSRLRALAKEKYGDLDIPENDRSFFNRLSAYLVLRAKGQYISPKHIYADISILAEIKAYIDAAEQRDLFYSEVYAAHEGLLLMMTNIDNPSFLHGVLMYYYPDEYTYTRDYLRKDSGEKALDLGERVLRYLKDVGHALSRKELMQHFPGFSDVMLFNAITNTESLIQWDYNYYNCIDNVHFVDQELSQLKSLIEENLALNKGYCSETMLYKAVTTVLPDFIARNGNMNSQNVFYTCSCLLDQSFAFKRPHIARPGQFSNLNVIDIAKYFLEDCDHIKASDYFRIAQKLMWPEVTAGIVFAELEKDYIRLNLDEYVNKACFKVADRDIQYIRDLLATTANQNWFVSLQHFCDSEEELPSGNGINEFFVGAIASEYDIGWHVVSPQVKDRRYQRGILVQNSVPVYDYDDLIRKVLMDQGITTIEEGELYTLLQIHSLIINHVPKELQKSAKFRYSNGIYEVQ